MSGCQTDKLTYVTPCEIVYGRQRARNAFIDSCKVRVLIFRERTNCEERELTELGRSCPHVWRRLLVRDSWAEVFVLWDKKARPEEKSKQQCLGKQIQ